MQNKKWCKFIDIMKRISDVKHLLVFCSENLQMPKLHEILDNSPEKALVMKVHPIEKLHIITQKIRKRE